MVTWLGYQPLGSDVSCTSPATPFDGGWLEIALLGLFLLWVFVCVVLACSFAASLAARFGRRFSRMRAWFIGRAMVMACEHLHALAHDVESLIAFGLTNYYGNTS
eukprot:4051508-Amphidinium_carterae.1